jgi:hypothetical protein
MVMVVTSMSRAHELEVVYDCLHFLLAPGWVGGDFQRHATLVASVNARPTFKLLDPTCTELHVSLNRKLNRGSQGIGPAIGDKSRGASCAPFHKPNTALRCPWTGLPAIGQSAGSKFLDTGSKKAGQVDKEAT